GHWRDRGERRNAARRKSREDLEGSLGEEGEEVIKTRMVDGGWRLADGAGNVLPPSSILYSPSSFSRALGLQASRACNDVKALTISGSNILPADSSMTP